MTSFLRIAFVPALLLASGCDNVGRAFDPVLDPNNPDPGTTETIVEVVPEGGTTVDGRPKVRAAFPKDGGWPTGVPVVVEFSESVNATSILPTSATANDARIILRIQGTTQAVPCAYDLLANNRLLVMRPLAALSNAQTPTYEVVLQADSRDCDGVRFDVPADGKVLTQFQVNQDESFVDGRIVTVFPRDNAKDLTREGHVFVVFDRPAIGTTFDGNLIVQPAGGVALDGDIRQPLLPPGSDGRVAEFRPQNVLAGATRYELVVNDAILFANDGKLDFRGRTPFARFDTVAVRAPQAIEVGNPTAGFDDKVNINNLATVVLHVTTPADTLPGDRVHARIYGGDHATTALGDFAFVERTADAPQAGSQTVALDFSGLLGTTSSLKFDEGELTFAAQMLRGSQASSYSYQQGDPLLDITRPSVTSVGPPGSPDGRDIWCDLAHVALYATASEALGAADLTTATTPVALQQFASADDGRTIVLPLALQRRTAPLAYTLTVTDQSGNMAATPFQGNIVQRGAITGRLAGTLTIEAYDEATLAPIADAKVIVDVGAPVVPPVGQFGVGSTDAAGRVFYDNVTTPSHTITIVKPGYDLVTVYDTSAAFVSLPLRPTSNATATLTGGLNFQTAPGLTALVSSSAYASRSPMGVRTVNTAPNAIVPTPILPNRPQIITAFAGTIEPTANPPFGLHGAPVLGATFTTPAPPLAPAAGGAEAPQAFALITSTAQTSALPQGSWTVDYGPTGLDLGALIGGNPRVRINVSLAGFENQVLVGVGFVASTTGTVYTLEASYSLPIFTGLGAFGLQPWALVEAQDTSGRASRTRALFVPPFNIVVAQPVPLAVPVITAPAGAASVAPAVTFADVLDVISLPVLGTVDVTASDPAGRRWVMYVTDRDVAGGTDTVQFPDISAAGVPGLPLGSWTVVVESRIWATTTGCAPDDWVVTERVRLEAQYAKSASEVFTVQ